MNWVDSILYAFLYAYAAFGFGYYIKKVSRTVLS